MRGTRPRYTIRRLMILVAMIAVLLGFFETALRAQRSRVRAERARADLMAQRAAAARQARLAPAAPTQPW